MRRHQRRQIAILRLPSGGIRAVPVDALQPRQAEGSEDFEIPRPDFRDLWNRREWLRSRVEAFRAAANPPVPQDQTASQAERETWRPPGPRAVEKPKRKGPPSSDNSFGKEDSERRSHADYRSLSQET